MQIKRLGWFLGLGFAGVVLLLVGLSWDAVLHSRDATLAGREGIFAWRNPGHLFLGLGMGSVVVSLVGAVSTVLAGTSSGRWSRPVVRRTFLVGSTALVVTASGITSWAATAGHDESSHAEAAAHDAADHHAAGRASAAHAATDAAHDADGHHTEGRAAAGHGTELAAAGHDHAASPASFPGPAGSVSHDHGTATPGHSAPDHPAAGLPSHRQTAHDHPTSGPGTNPASASGPGAPAGAGDTHAGHAGHGDHGDHGGSPPANATRDPGAPPPVGQLTELRYGPFVLAPGGVDGQLEMDNTVMPDVEMPCRDCFITYAEPDLVYADGRSANWDTGVMLHHAVFFNTGSTDTTCGSDEFFGGLGERFLASGNERTIKRLPDGFGYRLGTDPVNAIFHIMNHADAPQTVYFSWKIRWVPASTPGIRPVTPLWLDVANCRTSEYNVPAGPHSRHWRWTSTVTGRIIATGGHVHDGGIRTTLRNATTGAHLCTSWASYGTKPAYMGTIESMSRCTWDALGTVKAGEVLDLESVYNASAPDDGAMGIMVAYVYETPDLPGGPPPPAEVTGEGPPPPSSTPPPASGHHRH